MKDVRNKVLDLLEIIEAQTQITPPYRILDEISAIIDENKELKEDIEVLEARFNNISPRAIPFFLHEIDIYWDWSETHRLFSFWIKETGKKPLLWISPQLSRVRNLYQIHGCEAIPLKFNLIPTLRSRIKELDAIVAQLRREVKHLSAFIVAKEGLLG